LKIGIFTDSYLPYTSGVVRSIQTFKEELIKQGPSRKMGAGDAHT
jgi:1,2-diacylglycerol 3-alpha-glucosyltransferase